jgi:O-antigen ligase
MLKVRAHPPARLGPPELAIGILTLMIPGFILLFQSNPNLALIRFGDRMVLPFCIYLLIRLSAPREKEFVQLQWVALFIALSQSMVGFLSWYAPQVLPKIWHYLNGARTTGTLKDPDLYALLLVFSATLLLHAAVNHKSGLIRWLLFLATGLCAIFAFLSLERAAWLGGILVTIGLVMLFPKTMLRLLAVGAVVMAILGTGILSTHLELSIDRFSEANPVYDRLVVFDAMAHMVAVKPVFGWGYETLDQNITPFYRRVGDASLATRFVTSHNTYLTVLTELGLVGFLLYLFPVAWWFVLSIRVWPRIPKVGFWSRSLLGSLWLVMLFNFTVSNFMDMRWFPIGLTLWWWVLGLVANMVYPYLKGRDIQPLVSMEMETDRG